MDASNPDEKNYAVLAVGSNGEWDVCLMERSDRLYLELDHSEVNMVVNVKDGDVPVRLAKFLRRGCDDEFEVGYFGSAGVDQVALLLDDETPGRVFCMIDGGDTLVSKTVPNPIGLADALEQLNDELKESIGEES